jgi:hypothetical protein
MKNSHRTPVATIVHGTPEKATDANAPAMTDEDGIVAVGITKVRAATEAAGIDPKDPTLNRIVRATQIVRNKPPRPIALMNPGNDERENLARLLTTFFLRFTGSMSARAPRAGLMSRNFAQSQLM